jgi:tetratricopeptide (TPR) repeat protein
LTARPFEVASLGELERFEAEIVTIPIRIPLGIASFGVNAYSAVEADGQVIEEHDELGAGAGHHEELYLVASGHAAFTLDGEEVDAPAGTLVFVRDPAVRRRADARAAGTTVVVVGGIPGQPFEPSPWESWLEALPHHRAKDYPRAVEIMTRALDAHPDNANVLYNLACVEALAGDKATALTHLRRAVELEPRAREWARSDSDLASLRGEPEFPA